MYCENVTEEQIERVEKGMGVKFPESFRAWLLRKDKALPDEPAVTYYDPCKGYSNETYVGAILSFEYETKINEDTWTEYTYNEFELFKSNLPEGFIPFAMDGGGWSFCFDCRINKEDPPVIFWIGDNVEETAVTPIAKNFAMFLRMIGAA